MKILSLILLLLLLAGAAMAAPVTLIRDGRCNTAIYVAPEVMAEGTPAPTASAMEKHRAVQRARVRESVKDLAHYLGKMTGATVPIHTRLPQAGDKTIPILIGSYADNTFGPFTMKTDFQQGYRLVVSGKGVGMQGETDESLSYAIYELLDTLGCRWYIPGEMGEVIPSVKTITLPETDRRQAPGTVSRSIWYADDGFKRRNRMGGFPYNAAHALEGYVTKEQLEAHPDWNAEIGGKRALQKCDVGYRICWANPEVSDAVADTIIANLNQNYAPCVSVSPGDGMNFCDCEKCKALDTGDWDESTACVSISDRFINFANRVAERVTKQHPNVKLGFLAYVQFTRPPTREKLHPALIPQLAPITYCRAHTLDDPTCASRQQIKYLLEGWGKASKNLAMYEYYFHLAEVSAPFPAIKRNVVELPVQYANGVTMWTPETIPNFESCMPGKYLGMRLSWYTKANPQEILDEFYTKFYGAAAKPMAEYYQYIDDLWTKIPDHAGCGFSYMRRFSPDAMAEARAKMNAALAACRTAMEYRRVKLADDSLRQHELFMKMRRDYFAGRTASLDADGERWRVLHQALADEYRENYTFASAPWSMPNTVNVLYFNWFFRNSYEDMARIGREFAVITGPITAWSFAVDKEKQGEALGWQKADFADKDWKRTDVATENWSDFGLDAYYSSAWYRAAVQVPAVPAGKKVYLWVGATDGRCKVFVNGTHVPYVNAKGEQAAEADGYCNPFSFDITKVVKPGAENRVAIIGTRTFINELGTGGLIGPVLVYREK
ncbi:MAG: DUF4838 domain-containing protein [Armatimonadota bacterium]